VIYKAGTLILKYYIFERCVRMICDQLGVLGPCEYLFDCRGKPGNHEEDLNPDVYVCNI
jgi:hypothetical protein